MRGDHSGQRRYRREEHARPDGDHRIAGLNAVQLRGNEPAERDRARDADREADAEEQQHFSHHQPDDTARLGAEREAAERRTHYMKCPKCGADLVTTDFEGVQVDRCPECQGVWLDAGELEHLHQRQDRNVLARIVSDVRKALSDKKDA